MKSATIVLRLATAASAFALALTATNALAVTPITLGDLLVYRVGTGVGALSTTATAVFLDEYTVTGTKIQSIALPTTGASELTAVGNDNTEGIMSLSQTYSPFGSLTVVFTGYRADAGSANPSTVDPGTVNRVIGTVDLSGVVNTSVAMTDAAGTIRSATSTDGSSLFYAGTSVGTRYIGSPSGASTSIQIDSRNTRQSLLKNNTLFGSSTLAGNTVKVQSFGTLPTGTTTGTAVITQGTTDTINGYMLFDLSLAVAGADTMYALSTVQNKLYKYSLIGGVWVATGSVSANGALDLTGATSGSTVNLYLTKGTTIYGEVDNTGYNGTLTASMSTIATASANTAFRGIALIPEPSTFSLGLMAAATLLALRRRRS